MEVSTLVSQMNETLSTIHNTIASLNTAEHDARLDELEQEREKHLQALHTAFSDESSAISQKRKAEREEIAERRRKEDEERERRRRQEDEEFEAKARAEDEERDGDFREHTKEVEEKTDHLMAQVEEEAQRLLEEGKERLRVLEEKRRVSFNSAFALSGYGNMKLTFRLQQLNRLIDEQLQMPLPPPPSRARRSLRAGSIGPAVAIESKRSEPALEAVQPMSNPVVKAHKDDSDQDDIHEDEILLPPTTYSPESVEVSLTVPDFAAATRSEDKKVDEEEVNAPEAVAETHMGGEALGDDENDALVPRSYPAEKEEEDEEEIIFIAAMPALSRCNSRDPSAEMHARFAAAKYEDDVVMGDHSKEEQVTSSDNTHEEPLVVEDKGGPEREQIQEEEPGSHFEDIQEEDVSFERDDDVRKQAPAIGSADMDAEVTAAEDDGDLKGNQLPETEPVSHDIPTQAVITKDGDSSLDNEHLQQQESGDYPADIDTQSAPAEREEACLQHDLSPEEEPDTRFRSDSAELAWWEQKRLHDLSEAAAFVEKAQEEAKRLEESEAVPDTLEHTAVEIDEEPSIVAERSSDISHDLYNGHYESGVHAVSGNGEVQVDGDAVKDVHEVESDSHVESESQKETRSVRSSMGAREDCPLKYGDTNVAGIDRVHRGETPELTLDTGVADKDGSEVAPATVEHMRRDMTSPISTTDNNIPTASASTPVASIEFSKMANEELDMVETCPVDILSVGSPFDGNSSLDRSHQNSQLTADTPLSKGEERVYHENDQDSVSEDEQEHDHANTKSLSDELRDHDDEGLEDELVDQTGLCADPDAHAVETVTPEKVGGEDHTNNNFKRQEGINKSGVEEEHARHDELTFEVVDGPQAPEPFHEHELALESHTGDHTEHHTSEDHLLAEEVMCIEAEAETPAQEQYSLDAHEAVSLAGEARQHILREEDHVMSQEDGHDASHRDEVPHEEAVQVLHATATDPEDHRNSTDGVVDGYFEHEAHKPSHLEVAAHSTGYLMPLATSNTDVESQAFFTPLASAEYRSPITAGESPGQYTTSNPDEHADESHQVDTNNTPADQEVYDEEPYTEVGLHRTSTSGDSYEQDSNNGYESSQHELELEDGYSTTVHGQDHLFDDDHSDDSTDHKDTTPADEIVRLSHFAQEVNHHKKIYDHGLQDYAEPSALKNADHDSHYKYEPVTPVAAEVMFSADHDSSADRKDSWTVEVERNGRDEERVEQPSFNSSPKADHSYKDDHRHGQGQGNTTEYEQPTEVTIAPDSMEQEKDEPHPSTSTIDKGLVISRHNPERPQTPDQPTHHHHQTSSNSGTDLGSSPEDSFAPRDVTNVPWHSRTESTRSGSTLSESSPSSPVHATTGNHEPMIRESWPTSGQNGSPFRGLSSITGRPRTDSHMTDYSSQENSVGNNNAKQLGPSPMTLWQRREHDGNGEYQRPASVVEISTSARDDSLSNGVNPASAGNVNRNSVGGSLFQRMRSVFENQNQAAALPGHGATSPTVGVRSRAGSNLFTGTTTSWNGVSEGGKVGTSSRDELVRPGDVAGAYEYDGRGYDYGSGRGEDGDGDGEGSSLLSRHGREDRRVLDGNMDLN